MNDARKCDLDESQSVDSANNGANSGEVPSSDWLITVHDQYQQSLLRYCHSLTRDVHQSQEVVQESFLKLAQQTNRPEGSHLQPWLFRVCRNQIIDQKRRQKKMTFNSLQEQDLLTSESSPESVASQTETQKQVMNLITALPEKQQEVLRLKFQNSMSYKQIAEVTGETVGNVGVILHTAIGKLRKRVGAEG